MLATLDTGIKGGGWHNLIGGIYRPSVLAEAFAQVEATAFAPAGAAGTRCAGVDERVEAFGFLGYRFILHRRWPRKKSLGKFRDAIRAKIVRTAGQSLKAIIKWIKPVARVWFEYFKHSYHTTFPGMAGFIRRRARSILRKQTGRHGSSKASGTDHTRWPIANF